MTELQKFIMKMKEKYNDEVVIVKNTDQNQELKDVPEDMAEFYRNYKSVTFPFGEIDNLETAIEHSKKAEPFKSEGWFCFGFDGYFSYWLCSYQKDEDGLSITYWDHETACEIEATYSSLVEFLGAMEEEYSEQNY